MVEHILSAIDNINDAVVESTIDVNLALVNEYCKEAAILYNSQQFYQEADDGQESGKKESIFKKILNGLKKVFEVIVNKLGNLKSKFTASKLGKAIEKWKKSVKRKKYDELPEEPSSDSIESSGLVDSINKDYKPYTGLIDYSENRYRYISPEIIRENIDLENGTIKSCVFADHIDYYEKFLNRVDVFVKKIGECTNKLLSDPDYTTTDFCHDCGSGPDGFLFITNHPSTEPLEFETFLTKYKKLIDPINRIYSESKQIVSTLDKILNEKYPGYIHNISSGSDQPFNRPVVLNDDTDLTINDVGSVGRISNIISTLSSEIDPIMRGLKMLEMEAKVLTEMLDKQSNES